MHVQDGTGPFKHCVSTGHSLFSSVSANKVFSLCILLKPANRRTRGHGHSQVSHLVKEDVQTDWLQTPLRDFKSNEASNRR